MSARSVHIQGAPDQYHQVAEVDVFGTPAEEPNDILEGSLDDDLIYGQLGDDRYVFSGGSLGLDYLAEVGSNLADGVNDFHDLLDFSMFAAAVDLDLAEDAAQSTFGGQLQLVLRDEIAFEAVIGSSLDDNISGNTRNNTLIGGPGNDTMGGGESGDNLLIGKTGNDQLAASITGNNILIGGADNDLLLGSDVADVLIGGTGTNNIIGFGGGDIFDDASAAATLSFFNSFAFDLDGFFFEDPRANPVDDDGPTINWISSYLATVPGYADALIAAGAASSANSIQASRLEHSSLDLIANAAIARLDEAGLLDAESIQALQAVQLTIADLPGVRLAESTEGVVRIDANAAGNGWFVDQTPLNNEEFTSTDDGTLRATAGGVASGLTDLLSVVTHEFGHIIGLDHTSQTQDFMSASLATGVRLLPPVGVKATKPADPMEAVELRLEAQRNDPSTRIFNEDLDAFISLQEAQMLDRVAPNFVSRDLDDEEADEVEPVILELEEMSLEYAVSTEATYDREGSQEAASASDAEDDEWGVRSGLEGGVSVDWKQEVHQLQVEVTDGADRHDFARCRAHPESGVPAVFDLAEAFLDLKKKGTRARCLHLSSALRFCAGAIPTPGLRQPSVRSRAYPVWHPPGPAVGQKLHRMEWKCRP